MAVTDEKILVSLNNKNFGMFKMQLANIQDQKAGVVAQLVERSLPTPKICGWNPAIGGILSTNLSTNCITEKTKIK